MLIKDLKEIALHESMLREVEFTIASERYLGERLIKFINRSPTATRCLRQNLRRMQREGKIAFWIPGESFTPEDKSTAYLLDRFPTEGEDPDLGAGKSDLTIVCIYVYS